MGAYDDIIGMPHHRSVKHSPMPARDRAAQFSPFAALTGYGDAIDEEARITESRIDLDENGRDELDRSLMAVREHINERPSVKITYFRPDDKKSGGRYVTEIRRVEKVDEISRSLRMTDGSVILIYDIIMLETQSASALEE